MNGDVITRKFAIFLERSEFLNCTYNGAITSRQQIRNGIAYWVRLSRLSGVKEKLRTPLASTGIVLYTSSRVGVLATLRFFRSPMVTEQGSVQLNRIATVVVADVSRMDCQLLVEAIRREKHFEVPEFATTSTDAISAVRKHQPDVVLLSTRLQDGTRAGLIVLQTVRASQLPCRVIVLLDNEEPELVVEALRLGARGIFCRTGSSAELRQCIQSVCSGKIWASNQQLEWVVAALAKTSSTRPGRTQMTKALSKREEEIARLVAAALSNRELSDKLGISGHTVKNYLSRIFEKLGVSTRTELVMYVLNQAKPTAAEQSKLISRSLHHRSA
jgi:two-component system, NarL family, nitrate/nitrite response regulator NarL